MLSYKNKKFFSLYIFFSFTLIIGFFLNEDSGGSGGYITDFYSTLTSVIDPLNYFEYKNDFKFPLHYYITFFIYKISNENIYLFRLYFCLISLSVPYLFFLCLKEKFKIEKKNLYYLSLIIFLFPNYRSGAIWANTQITGIFFFLLSLLYFLKCHKNKKFLKKNILLTLTFGSLAIYVRQSYFLIYLFYLYIFFINLNFSKFFKIFLFSFLLSIPGIFFIHFDTRLITLSFSYKFYNLLLISPSILFLYLIPFHIFFFKKIVLKVNKNFILLLIFTILIIYFLSFLFDYNQKQGGGFFLKLSLYLFKNNFLFYLSSLLGLMTLYLISEKKISNYLLSLIFLLGFPASAIYQKYYEPIFFISLFLLFNNKVFFEFIKNQKNVIFLIAYFTLYLLIAVLNNIFLISKSI